MSASLHFTQQVLRLEQVLQDAPLAEDAARALTCGRAVGQFAVSKPAVAKEKDLQTLHEYEAHKEASQPKMNAWGARNNAARSDAVSFLTLILFWSII